MEHHTALESHNPERAHKSFVSHLFTQVVRFFKILLSLLAHTFIVIAALFRGIQLFVLEFDVSKKVLGVVAVPVVIYLVGEYLTLVPASTVLLFIIVSSRLPKPAVFGTLMISVLYSFFHTFLV
jgi:hypothetical protein